jgi:hypothetical protein
MEISTATALFGDYDTMALMENIIID